ncbi:hypothetical protein DFH06DRAFT_653527 [Mycena polygramma]|nr:hypothetical protein DFH06DRAFT_653527 [Mycena polygramma]
MSASVSPSDSAPSGSAASGLRLSLWLFPPTRVSSSVRPAMNSPWHAARSKTAARLSIESVSGLLGAIGWNVVVLRRSFGSSSNSYDVPWPGNIHTMSVHTAIILLTP